MCSVTDAPLCISLFPLQSPKEDQDGGGPSSSSPLLPSPSLSGLQERVRDLGSTGSGDSDSPDGPTPPSGTAPSSDHPTPSVAAKGEPKVPRKPLVLPCNHTFCERCITA